MSSEPGAAPPVTPVELTGADVEPVVPFTAGPALPFDSRHGMVRARGHRDAVYEYACRDCRLGLMRMSRTPALAALAVLLLSLAGPASAADVSVNGAAVPKATSTVDITQDIIEFREGGETSPQVVGGAKHYAVCLVTPAPVAALDAELPRADTVTRFSVQIEDARSFGRCLVASLKTEGSGGKRRFTYCLRCEDVTTP